MRKGKGTGVCEEGKEDWSVILIYTSCLFICRRC